VTQSLENTELFFCFHFIIDAIYGIIVPLEKGRKQLTTSAKELQLRELKDTIAQLNKLIITLQESLDAANKRDQEHQQREAVLQEQIDYLTKKIFGTSSERRDIDVPGQINLFNEVEQEQNPETPQSLTEITIQSHTRRSKKTLSEKLEGIAVEEVICKLNEEDQICPECGTTLEVIGKEIVRNELEYIPAKVKVKQYVRLTYGCPECKQTEEPYIIKPSVKNPLMKHSLASPSSVAWTMYQKYANGMPLYRQERDWKQYGIELSRTTLANWVIYCSSNYFTPMYDYFHKKLLERQFLMADETRVQVLNEPERKAQTDSFMWLYRTGEDGLGTIILYEYSPTRAGDNATNFLSGFSGYLCCDGYSGYNKVSYIKRSCCWAHVRRYFIDAVPKGHQYDYSNPAVQGVEFCNRLFKFEEDFRKKGYSHDKIKEMRLLKEKPVLEAFWSWLDGLRPVRNSRLEKAVTYVNNRRQYLETYLEDGRCSFSNNLAENAIRPFTIGRKNWLFSNSVAGAKASAIVYSIVEMAKANNLNIYQYLEYLLETRPSKKMTDEELELLAPWNQSVINKCSNQT